MSATVESEAAVVQIRIANRRSLHASYVPIYGRGGFFVPTAKEVQLGAEVMALVLLDEDGERFPVKGKVSSITFGSDLYHQLGFSFQLSPGTSEERLRKRCEELLAGLPVSSAPFMPK